MNKILLGYATTFAGFLLQNINDDMTKIKSIILFGSVARGTSDPTSDIDIFVETMKNARLQRKINRIIDQFESSELYRRYWKLLGVKNTIKVIADSLENWPDLKESIWSNGIVLYGKYQTRLTKKENIVILVWKNPKSEIKRVHLNKKIYGWNYKKRHYAGILENTNTMHLGPGVLLVPIENVRFYIDLFKKFNINFKAFYASKVQ